MKSTNLYVHLTREVINYLEINRERKDVDQVLKEMADGVGMFIAHVKHDYSSEVCSLIAGAIRHYEGVIIEEKNKKTILKVIK